MTDIIWRLYEDRSIKKLQNGAISLILEMGKILYIYMFAKEFNPVYLI